MSMRLSICALAALAFSLLVPSTPADAASRLWCQCAGKQSGRLHHRFACEYHFKKPGRWPAVGPSSGTGCSADEWRQFRTYLCVGSGCTYPN
jgi:hypothetical protein